MQQKTTADAFAKPESLLDRFGLESFRPGQQDVIQSVIQGRDVLCVMPTGGGKSLCYQLPSLARDGTTIVVSPLIALMKDQVDSLQQRGIQAAMINSTMSNMQQNQTMQDMADGRLELVYVAPERLRNSRFLDAIKSSGVSLLAVDEAHCISEWGHDFRPDYARLGRFRQRYLDNVQTIALTATATPTVREDIAELLSLSEPDLFVTGFKRDNLHFSVAQCKSETEKQQRLLRYLQQHDGAGIIYAATRKKCEEIAEWLPEQLGRRIGVYHAGMDPVSRRSMQESFMQGDLAAIVATNAFGMGIDKSDLRYIVHYNMPGSLEAYYQEAGRAGRDGLPSECILLFAYQDRYIQEFFIENRYPDRELIQKVYKFLRSCNDDPIELTLQEVKDRLKVRESAESIGAAETLLAKTGVMKRLASGANLAVVRIDSDLPTLLDVLPREAKTRRKVMQAVEKIIGRRRHEDVFIAPKRLEELTGLKPASLKRALIELRGLDSFDYIPPFRGRAIHFVQRNVSFDQLDIDFGELNRRKDAEMQKLEAVIAFARHPRCRQLAILDYFGDPEAAVCDNCDLCDAHAGRPARDTGDANELGKDWGGRLDTAALFRGIQVVLSGVTRMHGRFGKQAVAQMLCGSKTKKMTSWKLNRLSTYGLLSGMRQTEVSDVIDALVESGLVEQIEVDQRRPTVRMAAAGQPVMMGQSSLPANLKLTFPLAKRLSLVAGKLEPADTDVDSAVTSSESSPNPSASEDSPPEDAQPDDPTAIDTADNTPDPATIDLIDDLKRWRRKISAALGIPAFRVLTNATIERIAEYRPTDSVQLESIKGVGQATIEQFALDILQIVERAGQSDTELDNIANNNDAAQADNTAHANSDVINPALTPTSHAADAPQQSDEPGTPADRELENPTAESPASIASNTSVAPIEMEAASPADNQPAPAASEAPTTYDDQPTPDKPELDEQFLQHAKTQP
ncbi:MAG: RecQ family ATP-dependent DNA helicase, partial [Planctomycetota bacterium]